ncbi:MAG: hypothetical protein IH627_00630 [Rubrivivax sp.]|nr:hypothetical protein [Rubrivivax sp.]
MAHISTYTAPTIPSAGSSHDQPSSLTLESAAMAAMDVAALLDRSQNLDRRASMQTLQFWFGYPSTYSYLSVARIDALAAKRGVTVQLSKNEITATLNE